MARRIEYRIEEGAHKQVSEREWEQMKRLEHWYNSEFVWTAGRLAFKMYAIFPNGDRIIDSQWGEIRNRYRDLRDLGLTENEAILQLEKEGLVLLKKGGYRDNCIASGFTRVGGNEWNAYLVCEFLLKCSMIARDAEIEVLDEGQFIKCSHVVLKDGSVRIVVQNPLDLGHARECVREHRVFSVVDPTKYDNLPEFTNVVHGFNEMDVEKRRKVLRDWNWLGFAKSYDIDGDDRKGFDLNRKVRGIEIVRARDSG